MKDVYGIWDGEKSIFFTPAEAYKLNKEFKRNQPVRCKTTRQGKAVGKILEQSNLLHACIDFVHDNSDDPIHITFESTKMACKVATSFIDYDFPIIVRPGGSLHVKYRSMALDKLQGEDRQKWVPIFLQWGADTLGLTVEKLVEEAKLVMQRNKL